MRTEILLRIPRSLKASREGFPEYVCAPLAGALLLVCVVSILVIPHALAGDEPDGIPVFISFREELPRIITVAEPSEALDPKTVEVANFAPDIEMPAGGAKMFDSGGVKSLILRASHCRSGRYDHLALSAIEAGFINREIAALPIRVQITINKPGDMTGWHVPSICNADLCHRVLGAAIEWIEPITVDPQICALKHARVFELKGAYAHESDGRHAKHGSDDGQPQRINSDSIFGRNGPLAPRYINGFLFGTIVTVLVLGLLWRWIDR